MIHFYIVHVTPVHTPCLAEPEIPWDCFVLVYFDFLVFVQKFGKKFEFPPNKCSISANLGSFGFTGSQHGGSRKLTEVHGGSEFVTEVHGSTGHPHGGCTSRRLTEAHGSSRKFTEAHGSSRKCGWLPEPLAGHEPQNSKKTSENKKISEK